MVHYGQVAGYGRQTEDALPESGRREFLDAWRAICRRRYDRCAASYDDRAGDGGSARLAGVYAVLEAMSPWDELLDAGCGTGRFWPVLEQAGRRGFGIDQSAGMLAMARRKFPQMPARMMALQELAAATDMLGRFGGLLCVDVLQYIGPEDWPVVLAGFRQVLRPGSPAYLTVPRGISAGPPLPDEVPRLPAAPPLPDEGLSPPPAPSQPGAPPLPDEPPRPPRLLPGEVIGQDAYRYYPAQQVVAQWLADAGFQVTDGRTDDGCWHLLLLGS